MRAFGTTLFSQVKPAAALALGAAAAVVCSASALADTKQDCASAYEQTQSLRNQGQLRKARERALVCAQEQCPAIVKKDCGQWLPEIEASTPTVVFDARDASGADTSDVKVTFDGEVLRDRLDGKAVAVDPGVHSFRYEIAGSSPIEEKLTIREGDKNRKLAISFATGGATPLPPTGTDPAPPGGDGGEAPAGPISGGVPVLAWVLGGVGIVGIGAFATFGLLGRSQKSDDEAKPGGCAPNCSDDEVSSIRTKLILADVSLGVGIVSLGVATYLIVTAPPKTTATGSASALRVDVGPAPGGGFATLGGRF